MRCLTNRRCIHPLTSPIVFLLFQVLVEDAIPELEGWRSYVLPQGMTFTLLDCKCVGDTMVSTVNLHGVA